MTASSALMVIGHILLCYILFFTFNKPFGYGANVVEKNKSHAPPSLCSGSEKGLRGPCSPFGQKKSTATSSQTLVQDERRVHVMNSMSYNRRRTIGEDDSAYTGSFLVKVGFGTPVRYFNLTLDTGSYVTWVRCQRCTGYPCESQQYDPSSSNSSKSSCSPLSCITSYTQHYLDDSFSQGFFMNDTFFIEEDNEIPDFGFLCAIDDSGDFENADGILGLGMAGDEYGSYSLISQTSNNVFCHCLPSSGNLMGYVYFGEKAHQHCPLSGDYTPLISNPSVDPSKYVVKLTAITIGQKRVEMYSDGEAIMDTGTVITRLPSSVYSELRSEFEELVSGFNPASAPAPPLDDTDNVLHTCYNLQGYDDSAIPNMVLHFDNLDVHLEPAAVISKMNGMSCLAFAEKEDEGNPTIIGSHQMQKLNILYNIPEKRVEFGPGNC